MKYMLVRTYSYTILNEKDLRETLESIMDDAGLVLDEAHYIDNFGEGEGVVPWEEEREAYEEEFYRTYPQGDVKVTFPPSTIEDLARMTAYDLSEDRLTAIDIFDEGESSDSWFVEDADGSESKLDIE